MYDWKVKIYGKSGKEYNLIYKSDKTKSNDVVLEIFKDNTTFVSFLSTDEKSQVLVAVDSIETIELTY